MIFLAPQNTLSNVFGVVMLLSISLHSHNPNIPGMTSTDFKRINYEGSVNVFEVARSAGVEKFVFASSAQVYNINSPSHIEQFPILETNYLPTIAEG
jgi:nucleoside-diphosphate-sugar epimerase